MFEVGFTEIVLILGLALLVLGPEKLPGLAQKVGRWTGRARSMARQLRTQLEQEVTMEELAKTRRAQETSSAGAAAAAASTSASAEPQQSYSSDYTPDFESQTHSGSHAEPAAHSEPGLDLDAKVSGIPDHGVSDHPPIEGFTAEPRPEPADSTDKEPVKAPQ